MPSGKPIKTWNLKMSPHHRLHLMCCPPTQQIIRSQWCHFRLNCRKTNEFPGKSRKLSPFFCSCILVKVRHSWSHTGLNYTTPWGILTITASLPSRRIKFKQGSSVWQENKLLRIFMGSPVLNLSKQKHTQAGVTQVMRQKESSFKWKSLVLMLENVRKKSSQLSPLRKMCENQVNVWAVSLCI